MTTAGITIRRRNRSDGIDPLRTHSYAVDREIPSRRAASSTVRVLGTRVGLGGRGEGFDILANLTSGTSPITSHVRSNRQRPGNGSRGLNSSSGRPAAR